MMDPSVRYRMGISMALVICVGMGSLSEVTAQQTGETASYRPVVIDNADKVIALKTGEGMVRHLSGNIRLRQDSTWFYSDSAIMSKERIQAWGDVAIQQNDTTAVFADSLIYHIGSKRAVLYRGVSLKNGTRELYTDSLTYFLESKKGYYESGALLTDGEAVMRSRRGQYDGLAQRVIFRDSVQLKHPEFYLRSSALKYRTTSRTAYFIAPTHIVQDTADIYTEDGYYDMEHRQLALTKNAQYKKGKVRSSADSMLMDMPNEDIHLVSNANYENEKLRARGDYIRYDNKTSDSYISGHAHIKTESQEMKGDRIWYNTKTRELRTEGRSFVRDSSQFLAADQMDFAGEGGKGKAMGAVQWRDTSNNLEIRSEVLLRRDQEDLLAYGGRPLFLTELDGDTLYISSDTLNRYLHPSDSTQQMVSHYDVRIFKEDLQARCDSLHYSGRDSVFLLTGDPMMWTDTTQLDGDTMYVYIRGGTIDRVVMEQNAMIINTPDYIYFNQIQGKRITAWFEDGRVDYVDVEGNAQAVYYLTDEAGAYVGVNETESSSMRIAFERQKIATIRFNRPNPKGTISPMGEVDHQSIRLEGFEWLEELRPTSLEDLLSEWTDDKRYTESVLPIEQ